MEGEDIYLSMGVLIECEWVLRSNYEFIADQVGTALTGICSLPNVTVERPDVAKRALLAQKKGMDFADAVHVLTADADGARAFATFDKALRRKANRLVAGIKVVPP